MFKIWFYNCWLTFVFWTLVTTITMCYQCLTDSFSIHDRASFSKVTMLFQNRLSNFLNKTNQHCAIQIDLSSLFPFESLVKPVLIVTVIKTQHGQHVVVLLSTYKMLHPLQRFQCISIKEIFQCFFN